MSSRSLRSMKIEFVASSQHHSTGHEDHEDHEDHEEENRQVTMKSIF
jgi:hypothetical protein